MPFGYSSGFDIGDLGVLTAPGVTNAFEVTGAPVTFQVTTSSVGTNVVIRLEGSLDDEGYFNLDQSGSDTTIAANGTYGFCLNGCPVRYVRLRLVSISGGTPTVAAKVGAM